jgi:riboflavin synthase alpha subunit
MEKVTRIMTVKSLVTEQGQTRVGGHFLEGHPNQTADLVGFSFLTSAWDLPNLRDELVITIQAKPVKS